MIDQQCFFLFLLSSRGNCKCLVWMYNLGFNSFHCGEQFCLEQRQQFVCVLAKGIWDRWCCVNTFIEPALQLNIFIKLASENKQVQGDRVRCHFAASWHTDSRHSLLFIQTECSLELPSISFWILCKERWGRTRLQFCWNTGWQVPLKSSPHDVHVIQKLTAALTNNGHRVYQLCGSWWEHRPWVLAAAMVVPETQRQHPKGFEQTKEAESGISSKAWLGVGDFVMLKSVWIALQ